MAKDNRITPRELLEECFTRIAKEHGFLIDTLSVQYLLQYSGQEVSFVKVQDIQIEGQVIQCS